MRSPEPSDSVAAEAAKLVWGDREAAYGHPADHWGRTAALWSAILGVTVTAEQALLCMVADKISRACNGVKTATPRRDNYVDIAGYAEVAWRVIQAKEEGQAAPETHRCGATCSGRGVFTCTICGAETPRLWPLINSEGRVVMLCGVCWKANGAFCESCRCRADLLRVHDMRTPQIGMSICKLCDERRRREGQS